MNQEETNNFLSILRRILWNDSRSAEDQQLRNNQREVKGEQYYDISEMHTPDEFDITTAPNGLKYTPIVWSPTGKKEDAKSGYLLKENDIIYGMETEDGLSMSGKGAYDFLNNIKNSGGYVDRIPTTESTTFRSRTSAGPKTMPGSSVNQSNEALNALLYGFNGLGLIGKRDTQRAKNARDLESSARLRGKEPNKNKINATLMPSSDMDSYQNYTKNFLDNLRRSIK